jgi:hypothetical protein
MIINIHMKSQEEIFFASTEEFTFGSPDRSTVQIGLGETRLTLSNYAARDLVYRLASYLVFLEEGPQPPFSPEEESDNILPFAARK